MTAVVPFEFEGKKLTVLSDESGEPWFVGKEVAEILGYSDAHKMCERLDEDEKQNRQIRGFGPRGVITVNESGLYSSILGSQKAEAKPFKKWVTSEVLPSIRKTGSYALRSANEVRSITRDQVDASVLLLRSAVEDLKLAPSAVLGAYQRIEAQLGVAGFLPAYAVDASTTSATGSSDETKAAGALLEQFGADISTQAFNRLLLQHGFLEERERPSSNGGTKKFKVIMDLEYGKNLTSPTNPRESQPHWYVTKFGELLDLVLPAKPKLVKA